MHCLLASSIGDEHKSGLLVILVPLLSNLFFFWSMISCILLYFCFVLFPLLGTWKSLKLKIPICLQMWEICYFLKTATLCHCSRFWDSESVHNVSQHLFYPLFPLCISSLIFWLIYSFSICDHLLFCYLSCSFL